MRWTTIVFSTDRASFALLRHKARALLRMSVYPRRKELTMNRHHVKGTAAKVAGKIEQTIGRATGSPKHQLKGLAKQVAGSLLKTAGDLRDAGRKRR
jgi:uncharacterized protein YjbJ (UPF0337 family)